MLDRPPVLEDEEMIADGESIGSLRLEKVAVEIEGIRQAVRRIGVHCNSYRPLPTLPQCGSMFSVVFVESRAFTRRLLSLGAEMSLAVLSAIQSDLLDNPDRGRLVQGLGGVRKARTPDPSRQKRKRGGLRYLYMYVIRREHIHLLYLFGKDEQEDLSAAEREEIRRLAILVRGSD
jgi:hypothetical protein